MKALSTAELRLVSGGLADSDDSVQKNRKLTPDNQQPQNPRRDAIGEVTDLIKTVKDTAGASGSITCNISGTGTGPVTYNCQITVNGKVGNGGK